MRATVLRNKALVVDDIATPEPGDGEILVKTLACGVCGSDLHAPSTPANSLTLFVVRMPLSVWIRPVTSSWVTSCAARSSIRDQTRPEN
jgi:hypothetical protein